MRYLFITFSIFSDILFYIAKGELRMFKQRQTDMLNGVIWKEILLFFIPIMFGSIFQQLYNTADAMVVGNYVGKEALAAVGGSTGVVIGLLVNLIVGLSSGATVVIAQAYGSNNYSSVKKAVQTAMSSSVYIGAIFTVIGIIFTPWAMNMLNVPADIMDYSVLYMRIFMLGMIPTMIYNTGAGILRAVGDSKRPLYFLVAACITNIVLDVVFVVFFHWDVAGVAIATVVSQVVSGVLTLYILSAEDSAYYFDIRNLHCDMHILKQILVIGLPNGIQGALYSFANLFIQATVNGYGTNTVAAYTAFGKIDALFWNYSGALG
ncbi:MAG: polysaccharide biosynthesis C-terminal domain-containing protein, partial [Solobacterium sp.]|nr:polysaccharide biosynthesis C-terminal domain-containing protein [Solobacterium sp.]